MVKTNPYAVEVKLEGVDGTFSAYTYDEKWGDNEVPYFTTEVVDQLLPALVKSGKVLAANFEVSPKGRSWLVIKHLNGELEINPLEVIRPTFDNPLYVYQVGAWMWEWRRVE